MYSENNWLEMLKIEMFYLNTIEQLFLFAEQLGQLEVCLPSSKLLTGIPILAVFKNLRLNSNKTFLVIKNCMMPQNACLRFDQ